MVLGSAWLLGCRMLKFKNNLLAQFSVVTFVIMVIMALVISIVLIEALNRNVDLMKEHEAAVAAGETKLHGRSAGERFGLMSSAEVAQALDRLVDLDLLVKENQRHDFDSPFVRGWVIMNALQDLGMTRSITDVPTDLRRD